MNSIISFIIGAFIGIIIGAFIGIIIGRYLDELRSFLNAIRKKEGLVR